MATRVAIIDFGAGNLRSAAKAFERAARDADIACVVVVTADAAEIAAATHVVLPGDGAFADCRRGLAALPGMGEALERAVRRDARPFLGICVGMQLLATQGTEHGLTAGLDWIPGACVRLQPADPTLKIPHMGWNELEPRVAHPLLDGISAGAHVYFVHSYHVAARDPSDVVATAAYGGPVTAMVARGNVAGAQFHPEKSQAAGLRLLANFLRWRP
jgi:glutamine amidotransferase